MSTISLNNLHLSEVTNQETALDSFKQRKVVEHLDLVHYITKRITSRLPHHIDSEDMMNCGMLGLIDAVKRFNWDEDKPEGEFKAYAECRIRGQILDELRKQDVLPRSTRDKVSQYKRVVEKLSKRLGREPTDIEVAYYLDVDIEKCHQMKKDSNNCRVLSIETHYQEAPDLMEGILSRSLKSKWSLDSQESKIQQYQIKEILAGEIEKLPERDKLVISLYYLEEISLKEIGEVLEISESRVSQIHSQALNLLQKRIMRLFNQDEISLMRDY